MFILQPLLELVHILRFACYYILGISYHIGRNIFILLGQICSIVRDLFAALAIIGEELYHFLCELDATIHVVARYVGSSTNGGIDCVIEALGLFCHTMSQFFTNTRLHSRLLATQVGRCIGDFFTLLRGALLLIADSIWWIVTIIPRSLLYIFIAIGDGLVFSVSAAGRFIVDGVLILVDDVFRLTIGTVVLFLLWRHRQRLGLLLLQCFLTLKMFLRLFFTELWACWTNMQSRIRRRGTTARSMGTTSGIVRRTPLPRQSRSPSMGDKVTESQRCVVCRDRPKCVVLLPCKHLCLCEECADYMVFAAHSQYCPLCRGQIVHSMSVYI